MSSPIHASQPGRNAALSPDIAGAWRIAGILQRIYRKCDSSMALGVWTGDGPRVKLRAAVSHHVDDADSVKE